MSKQRAKTSKALGRQVAGQRERIANLERDNKDLWLQRSDLIRQIVALNAELAALREVVKAAAPLANTIAGGQSCCDCPVGDEECEASEVCVLMERLRVALAALSAPAPSLPASGAKASEPKVCRYCHHREHWGICEHRSGGTAYRCGCSHQPEIQAASPSSPTPPALPASGASEPTHRCKACGSLWRRVVSPIDSGAWSWSLVSGTCGPCCDVVPMGEQIEEISQSSPPPPAQCDSCDHSDICEPPSADAAKGCEKYEPAQPSAQAEATPSGRHCGKCGAPMAYELWQSGDGGHEDDKYTCTKCGSVEWVDGIDS